MKQRPSLTEEAQQWERILRTGDPADQAAFVAWIRRSPQNLEAYLLNLSFETEMQRLDVNGDFDIQALLKVASGNVVQLTSDVPPQTPAPLRVSGRRQWWRVSATIAACGILATCVLLAIVRSGSLRWTDYTTDTGEQRRIALADGSIIELNTKSHIRVSIQPSSRLVYLLAGEAFFSVQHDSHRPFRVRIGNQTVEDLGTQFSIYRRPDASTTVSVLDGHVQVTSGSAVAAPKADASGISTNEESTPSTQLWAGEALRITAAGRLLKRSRINISEATSWREHRLWFDGASLQEVAAEFNRYNKRQLRIADDSALLKKRYTGTFDAYDPESFVEALRDDSTLAVRSDDQGMLIGTR